MFQLFQRTTSRNEAQLVKSTFSTMPSSKLTPIVLRAILTGRTPTLKVSTVFTHDPLNLLSTAVNYNPSDCSMICTIKKLYMIMIQILYTYIYVNIYTQLTKMVLEQYLFTYIDSIYFSNALKMVHFPIPYSMYSGNVKYIYIPITMKNKSEETKNWKHFNYVIVSFFSP